MEYTTKSVDRAIKYAKGIPFPSNFADIEDYENFIILAEEVKRLRAENETLRAELTNWPIDYPPDDMV